MMRDWDEDQPEWEAVEHDFAAAWRWRPKPLSPVFRREDTIPEGEFSMRHHAAVFLVDHRGNQPARDRPGVRAAKRPRMKPMQSVSPHFRVVRSPTS